VKPYVDAGLGKRFGCASNEFTFISDYIADVIWCGSSCERDVLTTFQYGHLQFGVNTLGFRSCTRSSSTTTYYYEFPWHNKSPKILDCKLQIETIKVSGVRKKRQRIQ
jgi:hypothetical protein